MKLIFFAVISLLEITVSAYPPNNPDTDDMDQSQNDDVQNLEQSQESATHSVQQPHGISSQDVCQSQGSSAQSTKKSGQYKIRIEMNRLKKACER
ncbi:hypothetical protein BASA50_000391 [Batrachochytrium salamandrivorans]|uniref:Secreted protein n=1 Tax=Batrachochytrium salamandrivorans TaxID=1357716 RepID=A0ABQ8ETP5_9FUNG|nr:hypothetical protein BASA60_008604 [Batrachochytrium salamandrivorans]KAH6576049.1 hypothetical protein BASA62_001595 [Batrachochytrium salamandrivorans]KAH6586435.1 hypothetical protein BASA50_000391 [Batrachochytrium salamandrivorans]KAH6597079.1 hypothetical protein BASA61_003272 [Batrachochytrium salamandrivorans]KAH9275500.1 hypothetical protein BASA83_002275 [Batrachochytrium salamandrivorans]